MALLHQRGAWCSQDDANRWLDLASSFGFYDYSVSGA